MTLPIKPWRRRNGFDPNLEAMWFIFMLSMSIVVYDTTASRVAEAGLSKEAAFAAGMAGVLATCVTFFSFIGLITTIDLLRSRVRAIKNWKIRSFPLACLFAGLTTSLPVYYLVLWLAGI